MKNEPGNPLDPTVSADPPPIDTQPDQGGKGGREAKIKGPKKS